MDTRAEVASGTDADRESSQVVGKQQEWARSEEGRTDISSVARLADADARRPKTSWSHGRRVETVDRRARSRVALACSALWRLRQATKAGNWSGPIWVPAWLSRERGSRRVWMYIYDKSWQGNQDHSSWQAMGVVSHASKSAYKAWPGRSRCLSDFITHSRSIAVLARVGRNSTACSCTFSPRDDAQKCGESCARADPPLVLLLH
jgi:hypothetical protein